MTVALVVGPGIHERAISDLSLAGSSWTRGPFTLGKCGICIVAAIWHAMSSAVQFCVPSRPICGRLNRPQPMFGLAVTGEHPNEPLSPGDRWTWLKHALPRSPTSGDKQNRTLPQGASEGFSSPAELAGQLPLLGRKLPELSLAQSAAKIGPKHTARLRRVRIHKRTHNGPNCRSVEEP